MLRIIIVVLGFVALLAVACSPAADEQMADMAMEVREAVVEANDFSFAPDLIEVKVGEPVRIVFNNVGALEHDWSIAHIVATDVHEEADHSAGHDAHMAGMDNDPDLHVSAMPGASGVLAFTPTEAGTYEITCTVAGHHEAGMVGTLLVTE
ncbi:MAG: cupredoxin domain-containing protein [Chloroflexota bacterium]